MTAHAGSMVATPRIVKRAATLPRRLLETVDRRFLGSVASVATTEPVVALTFDDGPHPEDTPRLLHLLQQYDAKATFFMLGVLAARYPNVLRTVAEAGHAIGNHTWDHPSLPLLGGRQQGRQISACAKAIAPHGKKLFRPPYGHQNWSSRLQAWAHGYEVIAWSGHAEDWLDLGATELATRIAAKIQSGAIILLHDNLYRSVVGSSDGREPLLAALDVTLQRFSGDYRFVTVPQLLRHGPARRKIWFNQPDREWLARLQVQT